MEIKVRPNIIVHTEKITNEPFEGLNYSDKIIANLVPSGVAYKIIIPYENVGDSKIPPNYVGNIY